ncbi:hypothetical protein HaLaN_05379 [Haematococcus lacustris]|uniref:Uncharacterized protein n=1 Tax=Haematococcus lacustris TaxID=44745 RepID=A0A699YKU0_HAELA|nr:hypothetical protein HaLaN_05379 [Haematococcus lacustris]
MSCQFAPCWPAAIQRTLLLVGHAHRGDLRSHNGGSLNGHRNTRHGKIPKRATAGHPRHWPRNSLFGTVFDPLHVILPPLGSTSHNGVASRCLAVLRISIKPTSAQGSSKQLWS